MVARHGPARLPASARQVFFCVYFLFDYVVRLLASSKKIAYMLGGYRPRPPPPPPPPPLFLCSRPVACVPAFPCPAFVRTSSRPLGAPRAPARRPALIDLLTMLPPFVRACARGATDGRSALISVAWSFKDCRVVQYN